MTWAYLIHLVKYSDGVLYLMAMLLLVALAVIADRFWYLLRTIRRGGAIVRELADCRDLGRTQLAALTHKAMGLPEAALLEAALRYCGPADMQQLGTRIDESILLLAPELDRRLWVLDTIVTLAPLLGLFGTIIGMFHAFAILGTGAHAPTAVTGGVADALVATACGLFVAMVGLLAFNALNNEIRLILHHLDLVKTMLLNRLVGGPVMVAQPAPSPVTQTRAVNSRN
ncbi:MAG: MotA/TolQ/ExbB proton channel family protein [Acidiferrobacteraceae bacterium]